MLTQVDTTARSCILELCAASDHQGEWEVCRPLDLTPSCCWEFKAESLHQAFHRALSQILIQVR